MNKFKAIIAVFMAINAGINIASNIWNPSAEKILMALFFLVIAGVNVFTIKEKD